MLGRSLHVPRFLHVRFNGSKLSPVGFSTKCSSTRLMFHAYCRSVVEWFCKCLTFVVRLCMKRWFGLERFVVTIENTAVEKPEVLKVLISHTGLLFI